MENVITGILHCVAIK